MDLPDKWKGAFAQNLAVRVVDENIYSVLPDHTQVHLYDGRATAYDLIVGTRLYNRVIWGAAKADYLAFARQAVASNRTGLMLDAGCGSMLFTAPAYLDCERLIVASDQSIAMLRRARARLKRFAGRVPDHILLLQADLNAPAFRSGIFNTVLSMNVLHHIADAAAFLSRLKKLLTDGGELHLTTLVKSNRTIGDSFLDMLHRRGDVVTPRTYSELLKLLDACFADGIMQWITGNMTYGRTSSAGL